MQGRPDDDSSRSPGIPLPNLTETITITQEEVSSLRENLGRDLIHSIRAHALHGGRRIPKSTIVESGISLDVARAIMMFDGNDNIEGRAVTVVSDTKRLTRWRVDDDAVIMRVLGRDEKLVHPVRHDGTGIYFLLPSSVRAASATSTAASSSSSLEASGSPLSPSQPSISVTNGGNGTSKNANSMYHWARFISLDVKYDKLQKALSYTAKTVAAGSGRPDNVPEIVNYSRGEREDYPEI